MSAAKLLESFKTAGLPAMSAHVGVGVDWLPDMPFTKWTVGTTTVAAIWSVALTPAQVTAANAVITAFDFAVPEERYRAEKFTGTDAVSIRMRAESLQMFRYVKNIVDELNILRARDASWKAAFAAATNFADLKTRVAALPNAAALPVPTRADHKAAVQTIINADDPNN